MEQSTNRYGAALLLMPAVLAFLAGTPAAALSDGACEVDGSHRALDFLLGEWRLVSDEQVVGRSRVEKLEDGCLIAETWEFADDRSGRTYTSFDAAAGVWRRFSVSNQGVVTRSSGTVDQGELLLRGERTTVLGEVLRWRERLTPEADGRVARVARYSTAGDRGDPTGSSVFVGYYVSVDEPLTRPSSPAEPSPAPGSVTQSEQRPPPVAGEVTPDSERAADAADIERIAMASPMVLRLPLGAVEALPDGYAWITRDTAPYLCEGVTIERLEVLRKTRRGQVELQVELALHAVQVNRRVDVEINLVEAGRRDESGVLASGSASGRAGRSIPEQIERGSVALEVVLLMTRQTFDVAVAAAERPELVITLAAAR
ncbi:MAG: hypothetical protein OXG74_15855 [Acidobacteria bacterium]|nr:hypothetical protein [Acidobacteriota bacterium]